MPRRLASRSRAFAALVAWSSLVAMLVRPASAEAQCAGSCGSYAAPSGCWCDDACFSYGDCCSDVRRTCYVPTVTTLAPTSGPGAGGTSLTLTGVHFSTQPSVTVGGAACPASQSSDTQIICAVPPGTVGARAVSVTSSYGITSLAATDPTYTYTGGVTSVVPAPGHTAGGDTVTLTGSGWNDGARPAPTVTIGGATCVRPVATATTIVCTTPPGTGVARPLVVTVGTATIESAFSYLPPAITGLAPAGGETAGGAVLTLTGTNFGASGAAVTVGGSNCPVLVQGDSTVTCTLPPGSGRAVDVVLTVGSQSSNAALYAYARPVPTGVQPAVIATSGAALTITGRDFGNVPGTVSVGGAACDPVSWVDTQIVCMAPAGEGVAKRVVVTAGGQSSDPLLAAVSYAAPTITGITPSGGATAGGTPLTITGSDFGTDATATVSGTACPVTMRTATSLVCTLPAAGTGTPSGVIVEVGGQLTAAYPYAYASPVITSVSAMSSSTEGGTALTVNGSDLGLAGSVSVGATAAVGCSWSDTQITCTLPAGTGSQPVVVTDSAGRSSPAVTFTYNAPVLAGVSATAGAAAGSATLTLTGTSFGATATTGAVTVGGLACTPSYWSHTKVLCAPSNTLAGSQPVVVAVDGQRSNTLLADLPAGSVTSISPATGPATGGTSITIAGWGNGTSPTPAVSIGGSACLVTSASASRIVCTTPAGIGTALAVQVAAAGTILNAAPFSYSPPTVTDVSPSGAHTAGGATITVTGSGFGPAGASDVQVTVGGANCPVLSHTQTTVQCTLPSGEGSAVDVVARVGSQLSNVSRYAYAAPSVTDVSPSTIAAAGGTALTVTGNDFGVSATVTVGGNACPVSTRTHTRLVCTSPAGTDTNVPVVVSAQGRQATSTVSYNAPAVTSVSPTSGPTAGGTTLVVTGTDFAPSSTVSVGGRPCPVTSFTPTQLACTLPPGRGAASLVVSTGPRTTAPIVFTYAAPSIARLVASPIPTAGGTSLVITGSNLGTSGTVNIGTGACIPVNNGWSDGAITCTLPPGRGTAPVSVNVGGQISNTLVLAYDLPVVTGIAPATGTVAGGTSITLTGDDFGAVSDTVTIGGSSCAPTSWSHTRIVCVTPSGSGRAKAVVVTVATRASNAVLFDYAASTVTGITPSPGPTAGAVPIVIAGTDFTSDLTFTIGGAVCPVTRVTTTAVTCTLPAGVGNARRVIGSAMGMATVTASYDYAPPVLTMLDSTSAADGTVVLTLSGSNFGPSGSASVTVAGASCAVTSQTQRDATCTLAAGQGTGLAVQLTAGGQASNTLPFSYPAPSLAAVSPTHGRAAGGDTLTLTGTGFGTRSADVHVGSASCTVLTQSPTRVTCTSPPGTGASNAVALTAAGQTSNAVTFAYDPRGPIAHDVHGTTAEDVPVSLALVADDVAGAVLTWSLATLPSASIGVATVVGDHVSFVPARDASGTATFSVQVDDGTATATATITVDVTAVDDPPVFIDPTPHDDLAVTIGHAVDFTIAASDVDTSTGALSFGVDPLPSGASIDSHTGAFHWMPAPGDVGAHELDLLASDATTTSRRHLVITVRADADAALDASRDAVGADANGVADSMVFVDAANDVAQAVDAAVHDATVADGGDAISPMDARALPDASTVADARAIVDARRPDDAAMVFDTSVRTDAGTVTPRDAGASGDAGEVPADAVGAESGGGRGGLICSATNAARGRANGSWLGLAVLAAIVRRRRVRGAA